MDRHLLLVGALRRFDRELFALAPDVATTVLCTPATAARLEHPDRHRRVVILDRGAPVEEWVRTAQSLHGLDPFTGLVMLSEAEQPAAAAIGVRLGLPAHPPRTVAAILDKALMRRRLAELGWHETGFRIVECTAEAIRGAVAELGYPAVLKPIASSGSRGVTVLRSDADVEPATDWAGRSDVPTGYLVEQMHQGPEFSVEAVTFDGDHRIAAITRKFTDDVHRIEIGQVVPAVLPEETAELIRAHTREVLDALEVRSGVTHTEIVVTDDGPRLIETHLRPGGDRIPDLLRQATGVDLVGQLAAQALGLPPVPPPAPTGRFAAIWFASPDGPGVLAGIEGVEDARAMPHVTEVEELMPVGTVLGSAHSSATRGILVKAEASDEMAAAEAARHAIERIRFTVAPPGPAGEPAAEPAAGPAAEWSATALVKES